MILRIESGILQGSVQKLLLYLFHAIDFPMSDENHTSTFANHVAISPLDKDKNLASQTLQDHLHKIELLVRKQLDLEVRQLSWKFSRQSALLINKLLVYKMLLKPILNHSIHSRGTTSLRHWKGFGQKFYELSGLF